MTSVCHRLLSVMCNLCQTGRLVSALANLCAIHQDPPGLLQNAMCVTAKAMNADQGMAGIRRKSLSSAQTARCASPPSRGHRDGWLTSGRSVRYRTDATSGRAYRGKRTTRLTQSSTGPVHTEEMSHAPDHLYRRRRRDHPVHPWVPRASVRSAIAHRGMSSRSLRSPSSAVAANRDFGRASTRRTKPL